MTYNLAEMIGYIDDDTMESLSMTDRSHIKVSVRKIRKSVHESISPSKYRKTVKFKLAMAGLVVCVGIIPGYALVGGLHKSSAVDDSNRNLIGTEITEDGAVIFDKNGIAVSPEKYKGMTEEEVLAESDKAKSDLVTGTETDFEPSSYVEIAPEKEKEGMIFFPEIILVNNSACILTGAEGESWSLKKGDEVTLQFEKEETERNISQTLIIGYVQDGILKQGESFRQIEGEYRFKADKEGEYYFYIMSASSDYLTLKTCNLIIGQ